MLDTFPLFTIPLPRCQFAPGGKLGLGLTRQQVCDNLRRRLTRIDECIYLLHNRHINR